MGASIVNTDLNFLSGGGEMGERIRNFDWSKTPLGTPDKWESSLKTCVRIMLTSPQPMFVWWGDDLINIYNDAYRDMMGGKHPTMLGVKGKIVWKEIWDEIWKRGKIVFEKNEGTFDDALLLIMNRNGYEEETYFKFSYNPIPGTKKTTAGLFCVCNEETQRIINERTLETLRKIGAINFEEKSLDIIYHNVADALADNKKDFPFALVYKITGDGNTLTVAASTGIYNSQHVFPDTIEIIKPTAITKDFCEAFRENKMVVSEIKAEDITLPTGAWQITPKQIIHLPVSIAGGNHPYCIISVALNPYRLFDDTYRQFCQLISDRVAIEINKMLAVQIERKKAEALAEIDRAKTVFFANISHEFRTPLALILSPLEEILNEKNNNLNKSEKQNIETAQRNAVRLLKLVNTLLDFSSVERGRHQAMFKLVDLVVLTKNLAANFRAIIEKAGMKLIVNADTFIQPVYVDKQMWEKIVFNLLSNAFKYTLQGKITVELSAEKDFAVLKVKDTGVGIPVNELPKMFERFHRVQNVAGRTFEGTGIGLSLIKELVLLHHGEIGVDSVLNKGSVFTVKIPFGKEHLKGHQILKTEDVADEITSDIYLEEIETLLDTEKTEALESTPVKVKKNLSTVLVVDDNADMREHINSLLSDSFNVITASNGIEALNKMKEITPALVLSDIMMPMMDGFGLLKEIKGNKATANIPVIFLTARAGEESRVEGWEMGADDYLVKPFSSKELKARITTQIKFTQKKERALQDLYTLFNELPFAVAALTGEELRIEFINKYNLNVWQQNKEDVIGKPLFEVRPDIKESAKHIHEEIYKTGKPFSATEIPFTINNNGKTENRYFNASINPMFDEAKKIVGQLATSIDVTELVLARKKIEENEIQLQLINENLEDINQSLEARVNERTLELTQLLEKEKELNELKSRFVTMASHEFRTPLTAILSSISLIESYHKDEQKEKREKHISRIKTSVNNLVDILNDFLSLDKLEQGKVEILKETFDLYYFSKDIIEEIHGMLKEGQRIIFSHNGEKEIVQDKKILKNVFLNLLSNAIKYSEEHKEIHLLIEVSNGIVSIKVRDDGIGIPADEQGNLFNKFYRASNVTNIQGTGLGLYIVKKYVELLDGTISFISEHKKGTTFTIEFPQNKN